MLCKKLQILFALNLAAAGFGQGFVQAIYLVDLSVHGNGFVISLHKGFYSIGLLGEDIGTDALSVAVNHALFNGLAVGEYRLDLLGVDIFTVGENDHILLAATDVKIAILVPAGQITGMEPTIHDHLGCFFRVFVVTLHNTGALHQDLTIFQADGNTFVLFADAANAKTKLENGFDLSDYDERSLKFAHDYSEKLLSIDVNIEIEEMLDTAWGLFAAYFSKEEVAIKAELIEKYWKA